MTDGTRSPGRAPTRKDARREATKARLLAAAARLFAERGYDDVGVTEIAREAGVTHGMINAYFHGKAGILYEIISRSNREQIDRSAAAETAPGGTLGRLTRLLEIWAGHDLQDPRLAAVMWAYTWQWPRETEAQNRAQLAEGLAPARRIIARGIAEGELRPDLDEEALIEVIYAVYVWATRPAIFDDTAIADCVAQMRRRLDLVLSGVRR